MSQKDQLESNSSSPLPYLLRNVEDGFVFETDFEVTYKIGFADDSGYVPESSFTYDMFSFSITPIAGVVRQKDPRVEQTVIQAILLTFEALPRAIINYVCSLDNDQELARSRLFHRWYRQAGADRFVKIDWMNKEDRIYTSVIFQKNHPSADEIESRFASTFDK